MLPGTAPMPPAASLSTIAVSVVKHAGIQPKISAVMLTSMVRVSKYTPGCRTNAYRMTTTQIRESSTPLAQGCHLLYFRGMQAVISVATNIENSSVILPRMVINPARSIVSSLNSAPCLFQGPPESPGRFGVLCRLICRRGFSIGFGLTPRLVIQNSLTVTLYHRHILC
ncbi:hypothetical protein SDC9_121992 [bioreactor metagenome]|uniref:Uncharacterized protein n=1 Tax=bioreactor metagenome TaxID=1076179 RepID=A0A645CDK8_9ZZZZ